MVTAPGVTTTRVEVWAERWGGHSRTHATASVDAIAARVTGDSERPLLAADASVERIRNMLESREEFYADADLRIDTTAKSIQAVADEVLDSMKGFL